MSSTSDHAHDPRTPPGDASRPTRGWKSGLGLAAWIVACNLVGLLGALLTDPRSGWFQALEKPSWNPPSWLFGPVWTTLYVLMGIAAWRVWKTWGFSGARFALGAFAVQLALNSAWTPAFFGAKAPLAALVVISALWLAIVVTILAFWGKDRVAAALLLPYLAWVSFATALNGAIWSLNPNV